jgi:hypothetical protein
LPTAVAQEFAPRTFQPAANARSISSVGGGSADWNSRGEAKSQAFEMSSEGGTLRWRVKQPSSSVSQPVRSATSSTTSANRISFAERAHAASRVANASAFEDPFGDRGVRQAQAVQPLEDEAPMGLNPAQPLPAQPLQAEPDPLAPPEPFEPEAPPRTQPFQPPFQPNQPRDEGALPLPRQPAPPAQEEPLNPMPEGRPFGKYNERNCDAEGRLCEDHRVKMKGQLLFKLSKRDLIDTTPPLVLPSDSEQQRDRTLANFKRIPVRQWRNRADEVVATGHLKDVIYRHAVISDESGREIQIPLNSLGDDELCFLAGWWNVPAECTLGDEQFAGRNFDPTLYTWTASALCHKPLYFEETQLERYGHTAGIFQPALSGAHFFVNIAVLPYKMGINPPHECRYALGYYRPGSCAPWLVPPIPLSIRGAAVQAGAVGLAIPLIP